MKILRFLKKIILGTIFFITKEIFSFLIKGFLFLIIILGISGVVLNEFFKKDNIIIENESYIEIDLAREFREKTKNLPEILKNEDVNFYSLLKTFDSIEKDEKIKGVILKLDNLALNRGQIEELSKKIASLKSNNKIIYSYITSVDNRNYSLATKSNEIFMPPAMSANVNITGYYTKMMYYKNLADKLGIKVNVVHVGDYKSYGEQYVKDKMSPEYKENMERLLNKVYDNFVDNISEDRRLNKNLINERILAGDLMVSEPYQLKKLGMVDELMYYEQIKEFVGKKKVISLDKYLQYVYDNKKSTKKNNDKIAIIYAEGTILTGEEPRNLSDQLTPNTIIAELDKALKNKNIKGIVLRVNSPGGSALASAVINNKIKEVDKVKPVYVSIGGIAASGGYYISADAKKIFADKGSLTGSIGVVSLIPNVKELVEKIDINIEELKKGEYADIYSLTNEVTKDKLDKIYASNLKVYDEFLNVVSEGRDLNREYVHSIAQGKVWLGEEALELKLVDEIGGIEDTISNLAKDLNLTHYDVIEISESLDYNSILKKYIPLIEVSDKIQSIFVEKELYFKSLYYFPYNI
ncbi:signal peptide peptidase SppA [uncultured Fusobacterium sp.]|uniref:signal peptide peptidase SppA n=1 Tax=uncultured Fusobacterium sp. TaxID=159267 RepID=UPI0025FAB455|nr:signal peptide peptidase SppA [uncultured Fusobacterium sp.]